MVLQILQMLTSPVLCHTVLLKPWEVLELLKDIANDVFKPG